MSSSQGNYKKYVVGRNYIKIISYEHINAGRRKASGGSQAQASLSPQKLDEAYQYRQRAKRESLLRLADVNFVPNNCLHVTLTFRKNITDYEIAVAEFKRFTKRLHRKFDSLRYIATIETQKRGALHFHMIVNVRELKITQQSLTPCWLTGYAHIKPVTDVRGVVLYITKDMVNQKRGDPLFNRRRHFTSRGLQKCVELNTWDYGNYKTQMIEQMLQGRTPDKRSGSNSTRAGITIYEDYFFQTGWYKQPVIAKPRS